MSGFSITPGSIIEVHLQHNAFSHPSLPLFIQIMQGVVQMRRHGNRVVRGEEGRNGMLVSFQSKWQSVRGKCGCNILALQMIDERLKYKLVVK